MEVAATLVILYKGFKLANSIRQVAMFVSEDESLRAVLETIGEQEYAAAQRSLGDAKQSGDPRREMESALTIFRLALERDVPTETKMIVALTISGIYKAFNEGSLTAKFLNLADHYFEEDLKNRRDDIETLKQAGKVIGGVEEAGKLVMKSVLRSQLGMFAGLMEKKMEEGEMKSGASYEKRTRQTGELADTAELAIKEQKKAFSRIHEFLSQ